MAMPISTSEEHRERYNGDADHWLHVMESLFEESIQIAGFSPIRPVAQGSHLIHGQIIKHLSTADLVLVDLSSHNPNVFFELGVRTALNLPVALVRDEHTTLPFDTSGINTFAYDSRLQGWEISRLQKSLAKHILESHESCGGQNPLWRQFGLTIRASEPDANETPLEAKVDLLTNQISRLQSEFSYQRDSTREPGLDIEAALNRGVIRENSRTTQPSELFASAISRNLNMRDQILVEIVSPREALVHIGDSVDGATVERVHELADRYGVIAVLARMFDAAQETNVPRNAASVTKRNARESGTGGFGNSGRRGSGGS